MSDMDRAVAEAFAYQRNWTEIREPQYSESLGWVQMNISWGKKEVINPLSQWGVVQ